MSYKKSLDSILADIITDFNNLAPDRDTTMGSDTFIDASCQASCSWGIYKFIGYVRDQISPMTCDSEFLTKHAAQFGITRIADESDNDLLTRLLAHLQHPPAGGNQYDYVAWAKEVSVSHTATWQANHAYVAMDVIRITAEDGDWLIICTAGGISGASVPEWRTYAGNETVDNSVTWQIWAAGDFIEHAEIVNFYRHRMGMGSITLIVQTNYEQIDDNAYLDGIASNKLLADILEYIDEKGPVNAWNYAVSAPDRAHTPVTVTFPIGATTAAQRAKIKSDIIAHMLNLAVGETLFQASIFAICVDNGAPDVTSIAPASNVICYPSAGHENEYQTICPYDLFGEEIVTVIEA